MSITPTEAVSGGFYTHPADPNAKSKGTTADKDTFLSLMVAQMRYQDPMNPTDSSQFLAQTAQFTALEKMTAVADATNALLAAQTAFGASNLVGRTVTYLDSNGAPTSGTVDAVEFGKTGPSLKVGDTHLALSDLLSVQAN